MRVRKTFVIFPTSPLPPSHGARTGFTVPTAWSATTKVNYRIKVATKNFAQVFSAHFIPQGFTNFSPKNPASAFQHHLQHRKRERKKKEKKTYCQHILKFNFFLKRIFFLCVRSQPNDVHQIELYPTSRTLRPNEPRFLRVKRVVS